MMKGSAAVVLALVGAALLATPGALAGAGEPFDKLRAPSNVEGLKIPLTVTESAGQGRGSECVTMGVPLLPGQVKDAKALRLLDAEGQEVPAQFRELARWWYKDNSLRWVLLDFHAGVGEFGRKQFTLTDGRAAEYQSPLKVEETPEAITVTTGLAQFVINRKKFNLFERVRIDANGDGKFADDEEAVSPNPESGSVVVDTFGQKYLSSEGTTEVKVEEAGPVRVCVLAKGVHKAPGGKGYSRGMYGFEIRMHFYAGKAVVRFDAVIHNSLAEPTGSPTFKDFSIVTKVNAQPEPVPDEPAAPKVVTFRIYGQAALFDELKEGESAAIYQDSNGAETWKVNPGMEGAGAGDLSSFRGYRITLRGKDGEKVLASGDHALGLAAMGGEKFGAVVVPRYFWQVFPKAVEVGYDGTVRVGILPREYKAVHWLQDASAASQEFWMVFYSRPSKLPDWARDTITRSRWKGILRDRPWPHVIADNLNPPLMATCTKEHYAACGALADVGPFLPTSDDHGFPLAVTERRYFSTDYLKGNAFGWQVFGCRWEEYAGHSPWNYEAIWSSDFLNRFVSTLHPTWAEFGYRRGRHTRDIRAYRVEAANPFLPSVPKIGEDIGSRPQPTGDEVAKYTQGRYARSEWSLPNREHMNLDELHDLYCLFGDIRALDCARSAAGIGGFYVGSGDANIPITRSTGWCFRTLLRYYDLAGDQNCAPYVHKALDNFWQVARRGRSAAQLQGDNDWFYNIFSRAVVTAYAVTGDERMRDLAIGMAQGRTAKMDEFALLNAFCYDQTGLECYANPKGASYARLGGGGYSDYFPACNAYLWTKPRPDKTAPAAVKDLAAEPAEAGEVKVTWTAPADEADGGAAVYQVKYDDQPIVENGKGGGVNFWGAENAAGEPAPKKGGEQETFTVKKLKPGTYHFAMKSRDKCNNESPLSNVVKVEVK
jgi:hypothetical protein